MVEIVKCVGQSPVDENEYDEKGSSVDISTVNNNVR